MMALRHLLLLVSGGSPVARGAAPFSTSAAERPPAAPEDPCAPLFMAALQRVDLQVRKQEQDRSTVVTDIRATKNEKDALHFFQDENKGSASRSEEAFFREYETAYATLFPKFQRVRENKEVDEEEDRYPLSAHEQIAHNPSVAAFACRELVREVEANRSRSSSSSSAKEQEQEDPFREVRLRAERSYREYGQLEFYEREFYLQALLQVLTNSYSWKDRLLRLEQHNDPWLRSGLRKAELNRALPPPSHLVALLAIGNRVVAPAPADSDAPQVVPRDEGHPQTRTLFERGMRRLVVAAAASEPRDKGLLRAVVRVLLQRLLRLVDPLDEEVKPLPEAAAGQMEGGEEELALLSELWDRDASVVRVVGEEEDQGDVRSTIVLHLFGLCRYDREPNCDDSKKRVWPVMYPYLEALLLAKGGVRGAEEWLEDVDLTLTLSAEPDEVTPEDDVNDSGNEDVLMKGAAGWRAEESLLRKILRHAPDGARTDVAARLAGVAWPPSVGDYGFFSHASHRSQRGTKKEQHQGSEQEDGSTSRTPPSTPSLEPSRTQKMRETALYALLSLRESPSPKLRFEAAEQVAVFLARMNQSLASTSSSTTPSVHRKEDKKDMTRAVFLHQANPSAATAAVVDFATKLFQSETAAGLAEFAKLDRECEQDESVSGPSACGNEQYEQKIEQLVNRLTEDSPLDYVQRTRDVLGGNAFSSRGSRGVFGLLADPMGHGEHDWESGVRGVMALLDDVNDAARELLQETLLVAPGQKGGPAAEPIFWWQFDSERTRRVLARKLSWLYAPVLSVFFDSVRQAGFLTGSEGNPATLPTTSDAGKSVKFRFLQALNPDRRGILASAAQNLLAAWTITNFYTGFPSDNRKKPAQDGGGLPWVVERRGPQEVVPVRHLDDFAVLSEVWARQSRARRGMHFDGCTSMDGTGATVDLVHVLLELLRGEDDTNETGGAMSTNLRSVVQYFVSMELGRMEIIRRFQSEVRERMAEEERLPRARRSAGGLRPLPLRNLGLLTDESSQLSAELQREIFAALENRETPLFARVFRLHPDFNQLLEKLSAKMRAGYFANLRERLSPLPNVVNMGDHNDIMGKRGRQLAFVQHSRGSSSTESSSTTSTEQAWEHFIFLMGGMEHIATEGTAAEPVVHEIGRRGPATAAVLRAMPPWTSTGQK